MDDGTEKREIKEIPISDIKVGERFRKDLGDLNPLAKSIREIGLLHPVVINENNELIAGARRLEACKKLGWTDIPVTVVNLEDLRRGEYDENVYRKAFLPSEMVAIAKALKPEVEKEAKERIKEGGRRGGKAVGKGKENFLTLEKEKQTRDEVGKIAGVSGRTLEKAIAIVEASEKEPEKYKPLVEMMDREQKVDGAYRKFKEMQMSEKPAPPLPEGEFDVIYADPPWRYDFSKSDNRAIENQYPTMELEEICALKVPSAKDAVLYLWATAPKLVEALKVMEAWGFTYKTNFVWVKPSIGMGYWARVQHELLLVGVKGSFSPPKESDRYPSVINAPTEEHSKKPEIVYEMIEKAFPPAEHHLLELFARNKRAGWESFGLEVQGED